MWYDADIDARMARTAAQPLPRGRVTADSAGTPLPGATVTVTRGPDREVRTATTSADGRWQVAFPNGTGDYLVGVTVIGRSVFSRSVRQGMPR